MIKGVHAMFYSSKAKELREFIKDKLQLPCIDAGDNWLIFNFEEAELGVHPIDKDEHHNVPDGTPHISFYCDDLKKTVTDLKSRGVEFAGEITTRGYAHVTEIILPGDLKVMLYQPLYK